MNQELEAVRQKKHAMVSALENHSYTNEEGRSQLEAGIQACIKEEEAIKEKYDVQKQEEKRVQEEARKDFNVHNMTVNEEKVMQAHYRKVIELERKMRKADEVIKKYEENPNEKDRHDYTVALNTKATLSSALADLKRLNPQEIIVDAKRKKQAYLEAKKRYEQLSSIQKLKLKVQGQTLPEWNKLEENANITAYDIDALYQDEGKAR